MGRFLRNLGGVLAGLAAGILVIVVVENLSGRVYPMPPGVDPSNTESLKGYIAQLPPGAFLFVLLGWAAGSFLGSFAATRIGDGRRPARGVIVGALLLIAAVVNMIMLPHPVWFWGATLVVYPVCTYLGAKVGALQS